MRFDWLEKIPLISLGPLLLGHALTRVAICPLFALPPLPCPLASHLHVPHLIGGPGLHNAIRPTQGLPIGLQGPILLSYYLILALNTCL